MLTPTASEESEKPAYANEARPLDCPGCRIPATTRKDLPKPRDRDLADFTFMLFRLLACRDIPSRPAAFSPPP
jgi:hypothetical protein